MTSQQSSSQQTPVNPGAVDSTPENFGVKFVILTEWGSGFQGKVFITNQGDQPVKEWTLEFAYDSEISEIWNAEIASHTGDRYVIRNAPNKDILKPGETIHFAFNGEGSSSTAPSVFEFNGQLVGGTPAPTPVDPTPVDPTPVDPTPVDPTPVDPMPGANGIDFAVTNSWQGGFQGEIAIANQGDSPISGWTLTFEYPGEITQIWNAEIVSHTGNTYVIHDAGYDAEIAPNGAVSFGFMASGSPSAQPSGFELNGQSVGTPGGPTPVDPTPVDPTPTNPMPGEHMPGEHNHPETPLPDNVNTDPLAEGGQIFAVDGTTQRIANFDPSKDRVNLGMDSIHNQIAIDTPEGLVFQNYHHASRSLTLEGIHLKDLTAANFTPISDAHLQQDLSAALAWENGTGNVRDNTVYVRSHEEGVQEVVDFNPATDKISFFYLSVRGDNQQNFAVEQTDQGVRFYSPVTGQSTTLRGIEFSDLNSAHFEWRANQLEDNIAERMGLSDKIADFSIVNDNVFSGKSVAMAGGVDRAPYHTNYPDYTGTRIGSNPAQMDADASGPLSAPKLMVSESALASVQPMEGSDSLSAATTPLRIEAAAKEASMGGSHLPYTSDVVAEPFMAGGDPSTQAMDLLTGGNAMAPLEPSSQTIVLDPMMGSSTQGQQDFGAPDILTQNDALVSGLAEANLFTHQQASMMV